MSKAFKYTIIAAFIWAITIILSRIALKSGENAMVMVFWTTILSMPYWLYVVYSKRSEITKIERKDWVVLSLTGIIGSIGISITEALALQYSSSINYAFLIRTVILFTILFAYLFLGEKITVKKIVVSLLILFGSYLFTTNGQLIAFSIGDVFTIIEAILIAFGNNVLGKMAVNKFSPALSASMSCVLGFVPFMIVMYFQHALQIPQFPYIIIALTVLYIILRLLRYEAYQHASASYVTMMFSFTPVIVTIIAVSIPLLGESLSIYQILGGVLIVLAGVAVEKLKI
jgi:drug/metabolite transporter (DMT)-like permease